MDMKCVYVIQWSKTVYDDNLISDETDWKMTDYILQCVDIVIQTDRLIIWL